MTRTNLWGGAVARFLSVRMRALLLFGAVALVAAGCVNFTGSKVITNGESSGPFVVRITCEDTDPETQDLTFTGEGTETTMDFDLPFDIENFQGSTTCTITEIEQAGATSVTYQCGEFEFLVEVDEESSRTPSAGGPGMSVTRGVDPGDVDCTETPEGLIYEITLFEEVEVSVSFTVINDFTPTTTTTTLPEPPPVAAPAEAVAGQVVTFTG